MVVNYKFIRHVYLSLLLPLLPLLQVSLPHSVSPPLLKFKEPSEDQDLQLISPHPELPHKLHSEDQESKLKSQLNQLWEDQELKPKSQLKPHWEDQE